MALRIREAVAAVLAGAADSVSGMKWRVTIIREGLSLNGKYYSGAVLTAAAPLFESCPFAVYEVGDADKIDGVNHMPDSIFEAFPGVTGNVAGKYENVRVEKKDGAVELTADLVLFDTHEAVGEQLLEYSAAGWLDGGTDARMGLSIDAMAKSHEGVCSAGRCLVIDEFASVKSVDLVFMPAAGGHFQRLVASLSALHTDPDRSNMDKARLAILALLNKLRTAADVGRLTEGVTDTGALLTILGAQWKRAVEAHPAMSSMTSFVDQAKVALEAKEYDKVATLLDSLAVVVSAEFGDPKPEPDASGNPLAAMESAHGARMKKIEDDATARMDARVRAIEAKAVAGEVAGLIADATLSADETTAVKESLEGRELTVAIATRAIESVKKLRAPAGAPSGLGFSGTGGGRTVESGIDEAERVVMVADLYHGLDPNKLSDRFGMDKPGRCSESVEKAQQARAVEGLFVGCKTLQEARDKYRPVERPGQWADVCKALSGGFTPDQAHSREFVRAHESRHDQLSPLLRKMIGGVIPNASFRAKEAVTLNSSIYGVAISSSANRALLAKYREMPPQWSKFARAESRSDFKAVAILNYGYLPDLTTITNDATSFADAIGTTPRVEASTSITIARRGNLLNVSEVALRNDDTGAIPRGLENWAIAALRTLEKHAADLLTNFSGTVNGGTIDEDSTALYTSGHGNIGAAALDATSASVARQAMWAQTEPQGVQTLGFFPDLLVAPIGLEAMAYSLVNTENVPGNANFERNIHFQAYEVVISPYLHDANNWYGVSTAGEGIRINFLDGDTEPQVLLQNAPNVGDYLSLDQLTYKIKFPFGGKVTDFRRFYGAIVA